MRHPNTIGERSNIFFVILMVQDPLVSGFLKTLLKHCTVSQMRTRLVSTSTGAFLIFLGANLISGSSTKKRTVTQSSTEAEYSAIAAIAAELQWVKSLLSELLVLVQSPPTMFSNNLSATYLSTNPVFHSRMKRLAINYHFVCDLCQSFELCVIHVSVGDHLANALTKSLSRPPLLSLSNKICVISGIPS